MTDLKKLTAEELRALSPEELLRWLLMFTSGEWYAETRRRLERLEQCEELLQRYLLNHEGNTCSCSICDAARAALEQK